MSHCMLYQNTLFLIANTIDIYIWKFPSIGTLTANWLVLSLPKIHICPGQYIYTRFLRFIALILSMFLFLSPLHHLSIYLSISLSISPSLSPTPFSLFPLFLSLLPPSPYPLFVCSLPPSCTHTQFQEIIIMHVINPVLICGCESWTVS